MCIAFFDGGILFTKSTMASMYGSPDTPIDPLSKRKFCAFLVFEQASVNHLFLAIYK